MLVNFLVCRKSTGRQLPLHQLIHRMCVMNATTSDAYLVNQKNNKHFRIGQVLLDLAEHLHHQFSTLQDMAVSTYHGTVTQSE